MPDKTAENDFNNKIDSAIDNLFQPQQKVEIDPLTSKVKNKSVAAPQPVATDSPPQPEAAQDSIPAKQDKNQLADLLNRLEQSFLTLDWEVTSAGTAAFQALVAEIKPLYKPADPALNALIPLMDNVIKNMSTTPGKVPPTAAKTLQKAIGILAATPPDSLPAAAAIIQELEGIIAAIAQAANSKSAQIPPEETPGTEFGADLIGADLPEINISLELSNLINLHLTILAQCINRILPLEKLFGQNELYEKYLTAHQFVRQTLEEEKDRLATALNAGYNTAPAQGKLLPDGLAAALKSHLTILHKCRETIEPIELLARRKGAKKLYRVEREIHRQLEQQISSLTMALNGDLTAPARPTAGSPDFSALFTALKDHIDGLKKCIEQVVPLENLFGKTKGYEKLHAAQKRIRVQLEIQTGNLSKVLDSADSGNTPVAAEAVGNIPQQGAATCPWSNFRVANWDNQPVALPADELAFEDATGRYAQKLQLRQSLTFNLKKLKKWLWSKLAPMFSGELGSLSESELGGLRLPRLMPQLSKTTEDQTVGGTLVVLYKNGGGGFAILDTPTKEFNLEKDWQWQPLPMTPGFMLRGFLVKGDERLPVLSVDFSAPTRQ